MLAALGLRVEGDVVRHLAVGPAHLAGHDRPEVGVPAGSASSRRPRIIDLGAAAVVAVLGVQPADDARRLHPLGHLRHQFGDVRAPGTSVWIARNGPPVVAPGFGSHVSSWLAPPASHSRMTRFCVFFSSPARAGGAEDVQAGHVGGAAAAGGRPRRGTPRRLTAWSGEPQKCLDGMGRLRGAVGCSQARDGRPGLACQ